MTSTKDASRVGVSTTAVPPPRSQQQTIEDLLSDAKRDAVPIRNSFLQIGRGRATRPGPMAQFVTSHDPRGLMAFLLTKAIASSGDHGWDCTYPSDTWIRALGLMKDADLPSARSAVSKTFGRLVDRHLLDRTRKGRTSSLILLREDGSGAEYTHPGIDKDPHFKLPHTFWTDGHQSKLTLPGVAVLLIALSLQDDFYLPFGQSKNWYGIGEETTEIGMHELINLNVIDYRTDWRVNKRAAGGWQQQRFYTLTGPYRSALRAPKPKRKALGGNPRVDQDLFG